MEDNRCDAVPVDSEEAEWREDGRAFMQVGEKA